MMAKLTERIILTRLKEEYMNWRVTPDPKYGFRAQQFQIQVLRLTETIIDKFNRADMQRADAVNMVWHQ